MIKIKRIYDSYDKNDGIRILVDRLWPRGVSKEKAKLSLWLKEIAPTSELRKWFNHDPEKWPEFKKRYLIELKRNSEKFNEMSKMLKDQKVTLLYGAKDEVHNEALVIKNFIENLEKNDQKLKQKSHRKS